MKPTISRINLFSALGVLAFLLLWKVLSLSVKSGIIFPPPELVLKTFALKLGKASFWREVGASSLRVVEGFALSFLAGFTLGIICGRHPRINSLFQPTLSVIRVIPVLSVILIAVLWFDSDQTAVFVVFLTSFPVICGTIIEGTKSLDRGLEQMADCYGLDRKEKLLSVTVPQLYPFIIAAVKSSLGLTWKVVVAAEIISLPKYGIGSSIQDSQLKIETGDVFAWTTAAVLASALFELAAKALFKKMDWRNRYAQAE